MCLFVCMVVVAELTGLYCPPIQAQLTRPARQFFFFFAPRGTERGSSVHFARAVGVLRSLRAQGLQGAEEPTESE